ncbi:MAG: PIN domain-containing protein [Candidatus Acidiferrum sp.]|jgi:predicted nucleic acid-binding protein
MGCAVLFSTQSKRLVLDTSVLVAALRSRFGARNAILRMVAERRVVLLATPPLFLAYAEALLRPEHRLAHQVFPDQLCGFLKELAALIEPVELHFPCRPQVSR